ncbi:MAG: nuclear transport factor 2 family protein [Rubrobacteraceae bacterium]
MAEKKPGTALDFESLRGAIERSDVKAIVDLYAENAEVSIVNHNSPPSSPFVLRGREAVTEYLKAVWSAGARHRIENSVLGKDRVAFNEVWEYPDGTRVLAATTLEVRDGKVVRAVSVESWDE